jgi:hypothetical protein
MPVAGIVTVIAIALVVLALAAYLLHVIWLLYRTSSTLGEIVSGLEAVAERTAPIREVVTDVEHDLAEVQTALEGILDTPLTGKYTGRHTDPIDV